MAVRYVENPGGIRAMLAAPFMVDAMRHRAEAGKARAEQISPVRTGHYKASFRVYSGVRNGKAWARLANIAPYAIFLERGTYKMKRQRILGRAMDLMANDTRITVNTRTGQITAAAAQIDL